MIIYINCYYLLADFFVFCVHYRMKSSPTAARKDDDALLPVCDDQGRIHYAFMEVCDKVFAGIPRQTIKSRMRNLGLALIQCPGDIQDSIRRSRPQLASFRVISLISKRDLSVLQAYHESRMQNEMKLSRSCVGTGDSAFSVVGRGFSRKTSYSSPAASFGSDVNQTSPAATASNFSIDHILGTTATSAEQSCNQEAPPREESSSGGGDGDGDGDDDDDDDDDGDGDDDDDWQSLEEESSTSESSDESSGDDSPQHDEAPDEPEIVRLLKKRNVDLSSFRDVIASLREMKAFYLSEFNHKRRSPKMSEGSWQKNLERVIMFLSYCATNLKLEPALSLVDDLPSVERFVNHIKQTRRVQNSTAAAYVQCLLAVAKFIHAGDGRRDYAQVPSISDLRSLQNRAQRRISKNPSVKLLWPQFQEVVRSLHCKYEETSGNDRARLHMNFTMLLLFAVNPGRSREVRTLRLSKEALQEREIDKLVKGFPKGENIIVFSSEGTVWLIERDYKTASKYGPVVVRFDTAEYQFVNYHLRHYKEVSRPRLLSEVKHDHFFVNTRGTAFTSPGSFSNYLSKIFQEYLGFACGTNEMRHALVEHFRSSPESSDTRLAESLARVCKHSLRTQKEVYDRRTERERRLHALSYLNRSAVNFILDEPPCSPTDDSDGEPEDLPSPREICALVPSDASRKDPEVLLAKVLKYVEYGKSARLAC